MRWRYVRVRFDGSGVCKPISSATQSSSTPVLRQLLDRSGTATQGIPGEQGYGSILSKYLEKSNVQMVNELVGLITAQRGYEINSRCIRVGDDMLRQLNQLIR